MICELCREDIDPSDVFPSVTTMVAHRECGLRSAVGGIGHLIDHAHFCSALGDPDAGLSYRLSAVLVDAYVRHVGIDETVQQSTESVFNSPEIA